MGRHLTSALAVAVLLLGIGATPSTAATSVVSVVARHSALCLEASSGGLPPANWVVQWTCNGSPLQRWVVTDLGGGQVQFVAQHSGSCLSVLGASTVVGAPVRQERCAGGAHQRWLRVDLGNGYSRFLAGHSGLCLEVPNASLGAGVVQAPCDGGTQEQWSLV